MKADTFTDHQGSLVAYTGNAKEYVTRLSYDAWGRRRNATDGSYDSVPVAEPVEAAFAVPEKSKVFRPLKQPFSVQCTKNNFSFVFIREIAYFCKKVSRYARNDFDT